MTNTNRNPRFAIGTKFIRIRGKGKHPDREETIVDILTTTNAKGEVVKIAYVAEHTYLPSSAGGGQVCTDYDVPEATIARATIVFDPEEEHINDLADGANWAADRAATHGSQS